VKITRDGVTTDQKARILAEITDTLVRVLGKKPVHTHIVIDEVAPENWGSRACSPRSTGSARRTGRGIRRLTAGYVSRTARDIRA
jgi:4-oxalocrotonate tautomerase family enzyme